ncbi:hypothetical protein [Nocardia sp. alder85J]|uniref:hypothetical protein n=1 Tax=Nocardia sp. alder85J TaxID=2862949 RepID=UPI001CD7AB2B|nr:hypothetical protein [Nocardia sp. alder85J]MCX4092928.1 hypothetical protein [Nocardia sp. alder85J]
MTVPHRPDDELWDLDVGQALRAGLGDDERARMFLFGDAAIAAARDAEDFGIAPYSMLFLSGCVRSMGLAAALELPEPVIGDEAVIVVRSWMIAAHTAAGADLSREFRFAQWLEAVGMLMSARRRAQDEAAGESAEIARAEDGDPVNGAGEPGSGGDGPGGDDRQSGGG